MTEDYTINLTDVSVTNLEFIRANGALITKYKDLFEQQADDTAKLSLLESLWNRDYKVEIIKNNNSWAKIKFASERSMMLFKLQWS
jgi:hypothetical protein